MCVDTLHQDWCRTTRMDARAASQFPSCSMVHDGPSDVPSDVPSDGPSDGPSDDGSNNSDTNRRMSLPELHQNPKVDPDVNVDGRPCSYSIEYLVDPAKTYSPKTPVGIKSRPKRRLQRRRSAFDFGDRRLVDDRRICSTRRQIPHSVDRRHDNDDTVSTDGTVLTDDMSDDEDSEYVRTDVDKNEALAVCAAERFRTKRCKFVVGRRRVHTALENGAAEGHTRLKRAAV